MQPNGTGRCRPARGTAFGLAGRQSRYCCASTRLHRGDEPAPSSRTSPRRSSRGRRSRGQDGHASPRRRPSGSGCDRAAVASQGTRRDGPLRGADLRQAGRDLGLHACVKPLTYQRVERSSSTRSTDGTRCSRPGPPAGVLGGHHRRHRGLRGRAGDGREPLMRRIVAHAACGSAGSCCSWPPAMLALGFVRIPGDQGRRVPGVRPAAGGDPDHRPRQLLQRGRAADHRADREPAQRHRGPRPTCGPSRSPSSPRSG